MNKKVLAISVVAIIMICGVAIYLSHTSNLSPEKTLNDDNSVIELKGEKIIINGLSSMIPSSYANGTLKKSPGIETYGTYESDSIYITVYDNSKQGDKVYQGDIDYFAYGIANKDNNPKIENITIANHAILYVTQHSDTRGDYRLAFFKVNGQKVLIEWLGNEITPDIKNIIYSFYKLN
ncbi:MAG: hypothetical protein LBU74_08310 [Methanobacteriaceae archaeon]|jgi:hypothetical protein|nr:hypothetical protein [Candidatus Methanorudis spinitermitis]